MYSATISPRASIKSDGQLHSAPVNLPKAPPKPKEKPPTPVRHKLLPTGISSEQILIAALAYLLLQSEKPDWMMILALVYILF